MSALTQRSTAPTSRACAALSTLLRLAFGCSALLAASAPAQTVMPAPQRPAASAPSATPTATQRTRTAAAPRAPAAVQAVVAPVPPGTTQQQAFDDAKTLGRNLAQDGAANVRNGSAEGSTVRVVVPGYTSNPPQTGLYGSGNTSAATAAMAAQCAATPNDPTCSATAVATQVRPRPALTAASPELASQAAADNPAAVLGNITSTYNACSVGGAMTAPAQYARRACSLQTGAWADNTCTKTLTVHPRETTSCVAGEVLATRRILRGGGPDHMVVTAYCDPSRGSRVRFVAMAEGGRGACSGPIDTIVDLSQPSPPPNGTPVQLGSLSPHWGGGCRGLGVYWEGQGCQGGACGLNVHFVEDPGLAYTYTCPDPSTVQGNLIGVPPDFPPLSEAMCYRPFPSPDEAGGAYGGYGTYLDQYAYWGAVAVATPTGWTWAGGEHYVAPMGFVEPHVIPASGDSWANTCQPFEQKTSMLPADGTNLPSTPAIPVATDAGVDQCVRTSSVCTDGPSTKLIDGVQVTRACWAWRNTFACTALSATSTCSDPSFRSCSLVSGATCLESDRAGHCLRAEAQYDCKTADATFAPAVNCGDASFCAGGSCWDSSYAPNDQFAYAVAQMEAHVEAGKDFDADTLQIFKGRDARCHRDTFGIDNCCRGRAYLQTCSAEEQQLGEWREQGRCHEVGTFCSADSILGCRERTTTFCCFSSLLARLVQEQGRAQLPRGWGTPEAPVCQGFTATEISQLDWSRFDLSEFYAQIRVNPPSQGDTTSTATTRQPACYFGQGRC